MPALTLAEFYALGARAEAFVSRPRAVEHVSASSGTLTVTRHGLALDTPVVLRVSEDGAAPAGLSAGVTYYAIPTTGDVVRLAATAGGAAVTITDLGEGRLELVEDIDGKIQSTIDHWSGVFDEEARGNIGAWADYPSKAKWIVAALAAYDLLITRGLMSPEFREQNADGYRARWDRAWEMLRTPIAGGTDATSDVADSGAVGFSDESDTWTEQVSPL